MLKCFLICVYFHFYIPTNESTQASVNYLDRNKYRGCSIQNNIQDTKQYLKF